MRELISEEDKDIASEFIFLNCLIENLEHDLILYHKIPVKLKEPYQNLIGRVLKDIRLDLVSLKNRMKQREIKVAAPIDVNEDFIKYPYFVKGYETHFSFFKAALYNNQVKRLEKYLGLLRQ